MARTTVYLEQNAPTASSVWTGEHQMTIDRPENKGGSGKGPMGGQVMLMGIGGCFASTLYAAAKSRKMSIQDLNIHIHGELSSSVPVRFERVELEVVSGTCENQREFEKLLKIAKKGCIAINTISGIAEVGLRIQSKDALSAE